jgi:hypothetical protein
MTAATIIIVVVVVLLSYWLSCWLSCCCCPSSRVVVVATAAANIAEPPTPSIRRHRRDRICCSYHCRPHPAAAFTALVDAVIAPASALTTQIPSTQPSLAVAITAATAVVAAVAIAFAAAIAATIALASTVTIAAASTDISASACSVSPDAWACGDDSPSRRDALELEVEAWREVKQVLSKFSGTLQKNPGSILRPQTSLSYPSQKKTAQSDVTAETVLNSALKKTQWISK